MKNKCIFFTFFIFAFVCNVRASDGNQAIEVATHEENTGDINDSPTHYEPLQDEDESKKVVSFSEQNNQVFEAPVYERAHKRKNVCTKLAKWCRSGQVCQFDRADWCIFGCAFTTVVVIPTTVKLASTYLASL